MKRQSLRNVCGAGLAALLVGFCLSPEVLAQTRTSPQSQEQIQLSFAPTVKKVVPAVVNISGKHAVSREKTPSLFNDPFFRRFFGKGFGRKREVEKTPLGSGVIVRPDGLIVTNNHVIAGAEEITVALADRREFPVEIVLADKRTDLAILKITTGDGAFPYLEMGDSDGLEVGDLVLAIGNPFGFGQTVTSGIVSALARTRVGVTDFRFFIQTDAAINPGNSGGALVTLDGRLIGINSAIYSKGGGGSIGIGFAVPANMARTVVHAAEGGGRLIRPWLGAQGQAVTAELAPSFGLSRPGGVVVNAIYPGGPADRAGIQVGDVITGIGSHEVNDPDALQYRVATQTLNAQAKISIVRKNQTQTLRLVLTPPPEVPLRNKMDLSGPHPFSGAQIANLSPALGEELGVGSMRPGVIVLDIAQGSSADRAGFRTGDVLLRLNSRDIMLVRHVTAELSTSASEWKVSIRRGEQTLTTVFRR
ncbi:MAG: serine protease [Rhodospirillaceae bacterium]|nr:MAG: serine protease [Rhodospirillaceae bacterium]